MLLVVFIALVAGGLFAVNYKTSHRIAPVDRVALSLLIVGFGSVPLTFWLLFLPSFAIIIVGAPVVICSNR